ncbi:MAG: hypothetical protein HFJ40_05170 [Clostridia bacterium]|nr:hypothetical protein [Clostridia bacterium]
MLEILTLSIIAAVIAIVSLVICSTVKKMKNSIHKGDFRKRIISEIVCFVIDFAWMIVFLYESCNARTFTTIIMWMWPALIVNLIIVFIIHDFVEKVITGILLAISLVTLFVSWIATPVQNMVYVHDMNNVDVAYTISSDEILVKVDLSIQNGGKTNYADKFTIDAPEMRRIEGKDIAVYHICNKEDLENNSDYIPGFIIKEEDKNPEIISKRIYFDYSYYNKRDALRTVRRKYPTVYIGESKFDVDDNYNPYQIYEYRENLFFSNGKDYGIIVLNLQDGTSSKYPEDRIPAWVDFKTTYSR